VIQLVICTECGKEIKCNGCDGRTKCVCPSCDVYLIGDDITNEERIALFFRRNSRCTDIDTLRKIFVLYCLSR